MDPNDPRLPTTAHPCPRAHATRLIVRLVLVALALLTPLASVRSAMSGPLNPRVMGPPVAMHGASLPPHAGASASRPWWSGRVCELSAADAGHPPGPPRSPRRAVAGRPSGSGKPRARAHGRGDCGGPGGHARRRLFVSGQKVWGHLGARASRPSQGQRRDGRAAQRAPRAPGDAPLITAPATFHRPSSTLRRARRRQWSRRPPRRPRPVCRAGRRPS